MQKAASTHKAHKKRFNWFTTTSQLALLFSTCTEERKDIHTVCSTPRHIIYKPSHPNAAVDSTLSVLSKPYVSLTSHCTYTHQYATGGTAGFRDIGRAAQIPVLILMGKRVAGSTPGHPHNHPWGCVDREEPLEGTTPLAWQWWERLWDASLGHRGEEKKRIYAGWWLVAVIRLEYVHEYVQSQGPRRADGTAFPQHTYSKHVIKTKMLMNIIESLTPKDVGSKEKEESN